MSETRRYQPLLLTIYQQYLKDNDPVDFVRAVSKRYTQGTLERLVFDPDCGTRRASVLALGFIGDYQVNHAVGQAMQDEDHTVRVLAEKACRAVWNRVGDQIQRRELADTVRLNAIKQYQDAIKKASAVLDHAPGFAEAWYQRGSAWFQLNDRRRAIQDWHQALELNPYHFVAAIAIGDAYLQLGNPTSALDSFQRALRLNPDLKRVRSQIAKLKNQIEDE